MWNSRRGASVASSCMRTGVCPNPAEALRAAASNQRVMPIIVAAAQVLTLRDAAQKILAGCLVILGAILGKRGLLQPPAGVAELADARDSKSRDLHWSCGFDPHLQHHPICCN